MKRFVSIFLLMFLVACKQLDKQTITRLVLLKDTPYETETYIIETHKKGPKVAIIGGIHGDEVAGFKAALTLTGNNPFVGEVLLIPRANHLATTLNERYPGIKNGGVYEDITYSDLNRVLPGNPSGTQTEIIADVLVRTIKDFEPTYIIDLHESLRSYSDPRPRIGDSVIYSNTESAWVALQLVEYFNETHLKENDVKFRLDNSAPEGSFNQYFGSLGYVTLTFETNRQLDLEKRIQQQLDLIHSFFQTIQ